MRIVALSTVLALVACAHPTIKHEPLFSDEAVVESRPLPAQPSDADLSKFPGDETQIADLTLGMAAPFDGILFSERRAARDGLYRTSYTQLRTVFEADRREWAAQRSLYDEQLGQAEQKISDLQPSWFESHKGAIGFLAGFILAGTGTILVLTVAH